MYRIFFILQAGSRLSCYGKLLISPSFSYSCTMRRSRRCACGHATHRYAHPFFAAKTQQVPGPWWSPTCHPWNHLPPQTFSHLLTLTVGVTMGFQPLGYAAPMVKRGDLAHSTRDYFNSRRHLAPKWTARLSRYGLKLFKTRKERIFHRHPTISVKQMLENRLSRRLRSPSWLALAHLAWKGWQTATTIDRFCFPPWGVGPPPTWCCIRYTQYTPSTGVGMMSPNG